MTPGDLSTVEPREREDELLEAQQREANLLTLLRSYERQLLEIKNRDPGLADAQQQILALTAQISEVSERLHALLRKGEAPTWLQRLLTYGGKRIDWLAENYVNRQQKILARPLPKISMLTPVLNGEAYIAGAIESILNQGYPALDYWIVDGGSTDNTMEIVTRYKDRLAGVISEPDRGLYDAVRKGFLQASGEILGYLPCDDLLEPGALLRVGDYFARHDNAQAIYHEDIVDINGWRYPNIAQPNVGFSKLLQGHILFQAGVFFRREPYFDAGGVNPDLALAGDWDLFTRMARRVRFIRRPGHASVFTVRPGQLSARLEEYRSEMHHRAKIIEADLSPWERLRFGAERIAGKLRGTQSHPLFFPIDYPTKSPPWGTPPAPHAGDLRCPFTGDYPDWFLLTSPDNRYGYAMNSFLYYFKRSHLVLAYPGLGEAELLDLQERQAQAREGRIVPPDPEYASPYSYYKPVSRLAKWIDDRGPHEKDVTVEAEADRILRLLCLDGMSTSDSSLRFLHIGCANGTLLASLRERTRWSLHGLDPVPPLSSDDCRMTAGTAVEAPYLFPAHTQFDIVFLDSLIEHCNDPQATVARLASILRAGGRLLLSTPNLDSGQIEIFGPTWCHWSPPYHRFLFSWNSLRLLMQRCGLEAAVCESWSDPCWTSRSLMLRELGLGAAVPPEAPVPPTILAKAGSIVRSSKLAWDWRGRGDYLMGLFTKEQCD